MTEARSFLDEVNPALLEQALTHKSLNPRCNYETLEFMGDSVLGFVITKYIHDKFPHEEPGFLTRTRTKIVRGKTLANWARMLGLGPRIRMDEKGMRNNWFNNDNILEDVLEAVVGAIYLDQGMIRAKAWILNCLESFFDWGQVFVEDNFKDVLMRTCQTRGGSLPEYRLVSESNRGQIFRVMAITPWGCHTEGQGQTKKGAEQMAARNALKELGSKGIKPPTQGKKCTTSSRNC